MKETFFQPSCIPSPFWLHSSTDHTPRFVHPSFSARKSHEETPCCPFSLRVRLPLPCPDTSAGLGRSRGGFHQSIADARIVFSVRVHESSPGRKSSKLRAVPFTQRNVEILLGRSSGQAAERFLPAGLTSSQNYFLSSLPSIFTSPS